MSAFDPVAVLWPATFVLSTIFIISCIYLRRLVPSIFLAIIKAGLFFVYYSFVFDGTYTFLDDWSYLRGGEELVSRGIGLFNLKDNFDYVLSIGGGQHFFYYIYVAYAIRMLGDAYFSPVALNLVLSAFIASLGTTIASREFNFSKKTKRIFFVFLMVYPDILAWSNIMNGKDILVLFMHVVLLYSVSIMYSGRVLKSILISVPTVTLLFFLRFYVPLIFFGSLLFAHLFNMRIKFVERVSLLLVTSVIFYSIILWIGEYSLAFAYEALKSKFVNPLYGFVRMMFTPIPFHTERNYEFLNLSSLFNWVMMPCFFVGFWKFFKFNTQFSRFMIFYILNFFLLYAIYGELQGPRHRVQLDFAIALAQFIGFKVLMRQVFRSRHVIHAGPAFLD